MLRVTTAIGIALAALAIWSAAAAAAPGSLLFINQVARTGPTLPLDGARYPAVSPDGLNVYASGQLDNAIVTLTRDPQSGAISFLEADTDAGPATLLGPLGVAVAPGGDFVYVAANQSDALVTFSRDPATGALTHVESLGPVASQLDAPQEIVLSPDGSRAYVTSAANDSIVTFSRDPDGSFSFLERLTNGGVQGIAGMDNTTGVTLSEDGANVYVTNFDADSVVSFAVEPDGTLDFIDSDPDALNLNGPRGLDVSPNGGAVYVGAENGDRIATLARAGDGTLALTGAQVEGAGGVPADTLNGVREAVVSPDGKQLYVGSSTSDAVSVFDLDPSNGAPTYRESVRDNQNGVDGLGSPGTMSLDSTGGFLYVAGFGDSAVAGFAREPEPVVDDDPPETTIAKGPKKKTKKRRAKFEFTADEPATFQCKLDKGEFESCDPFETFKVKRRKHTLQVRAVDAAGNVDATPAEQGWKVKKKKRKRRRN